MFDKLGRLWRRAITELAYAWQYAYKRVCLAIHDPAYDASVADRGDDSEPHGIDLNHPPFENRQAEDRLQGVLQPAAAVYYFPDSDQDVRPEQVEKLKRDILKHFPNASRVMIGTPVKSDFTARLDMPCISGRRSLQLDEHDLPVVGSTNSYRTVIRYAVVELRFEVDERDFPVTDDGDFHATNLLAAHSKFETTLQLDDQSAPVYTKLIEVVDYDPLRRRPDIH